MGNRMFNCGGRMFYGKWNQGATPDTLTDDELLGQLAFYRFLRAVRPDCNEILDKIHDILDEMDKRGMNNFEKNK